MTDRRFEFGLPQRLRYVKNCALKHIVGVLRSAIQLGKRRLSAVANRDVARNDLRWVFVSRA